MSTAIERMQSMQRDEGEVAHVFLYGTLMRGYAPHAALGLGDALAFVTEATIRGRIYAIAEYPGLKLEDGEARGELFRIIDDRVLARMDAYETCVPDAIESSEYARRRVPVPGHGVDAWVYEYLPPVAGKPVVAGKWCAAGARKTAAPR